jgi:hypothetical protein
MSHDASIIPLVISHDYFRYMSQIRLLSLTCTTFFMSAGLKGAVVGHGPSWLQILLIADSPAQGHILGASSSSPHRNSSQSCKSSLDARPCLYLRHRFRVSKGPSRGVPVSATVTTATRAATGEGQPGADGPATSISSIC